MSAALAVAQLPVPEIAAGDVEGLCRFVWKRISFEVRGGLYDDRPGVHPPLAERLQRARSGVTMLGTAAPTPVARAALLAEFEADLRQMAVMPVARLRAMVATGAASSSGLSPQSEMALRAHAQARLAEAQAATLRPRVSPGELVQRLAAAGVSVRAVGGNLHVTPAALLTEADRAVLREHKAAIIAVLTQPVVL